MRNPIFKENQIELIKICFKNKYLSSVKNKFIYSRIYVAGIGDKDLHRYELIRLKIKFRLRFNLKIKIKD